MASQQWIGRLQYLCHEVSDVVKLLVQISKDAEIQREMRKCNCVERIAVINSVLLEADLTIQICQIGAEFLLHLSSQGRADTAAEAATSLTILLEVTFLKCRWAVCLCEGGNGESAAPVGPCWAEKYCACAGADAALRVALRSLMVAKQIPQGSPFQEKTVSLRSGAVAAAGVLAIAAIVLAFRAGSSDAKSDKVPATPNSAASAAGKASSILQQGSSQPLRGQAASRGVWSAVMAPLLALPWLQGDAPPAAAAATTAAGGSSSGDGAHYSPLAWLWGSSTPGPSDISTPQPAGHPPSMLRPASLPDLPNTVVVRGPSALERLSAARSAAASGAAAAASSSGRGAMVHTASALAAAAAAGIQVTARSLHGQAGKDTVRSSALVGHPSRTAGYVFPFVDGVSGGGFVPAARSRGLAIAVAAIAAAVCPAKALRRADAQRDTVSADAQLVSLLHLAAQLEQLWLPFMAACGADRSLADAPLSRATPPRHSAAGACAEDTQDSDDEEADPQQAPPTNAIAPPLGAQAPAERVDCKSANATAQSGFPHCAVDKAAASAAAGDVPPSLSPRRRHQVVSPALATQLPPPYAAAAGPGDCVERPPGKQAVFERLGACPVCLETFVAGDVLVGSRDNAVCRARHSVHMACVASPAAREALSRGGCFVCRASLVHLVPLVVPTPFMGGGLRFCPWPAAPEARGLLTAAPRECMSASLTRVARSNPDGDWGFKQTVQVAQLLRAHANLDSQQPSAESSQEPPLVQNTMSATVHFLQRACAEYLGVAEQAAANCGTAESQSSTWNSEGGAESAEFQGTHTTDGLLWSTGELLVRTASKLFKSSSAPADGSASHSEHSNTAIGAEVQAAARAEAASINHWRDNV